MAPKDAADKTVKSAKEGMGWIEFPVRSEKKTIGRARVENIPLDPATFKTWATSLSGDVLKSAYQAWYGGMKVDAARPIHSENKLKNIKEHVLKIGRGDKATEHNLDTMTLADGAKWVNAMRTGVAQGIVQSTDKNAVVAKHYGDAKIASGDLRETPSGVVPANGGTKAAPAPTAVVAPPKR
jgi:hypothetical protein